MLIYITLPRRNVCRCMQEAENMEDSSMQLYPMHKPIRDHRWHAMKTTHSDLWYVILTLPCLKRTKDEEENSDDSDWWQCMATYDKSHVCTHTTLGGTTEGIDDYPWWHTLQFMVGRSNASIPQARENYTSAKPSTFNKEAKTKYLSTLRPD